MKLKVLAVLPFLCASLFAQQQSTPTCDQHAVINVTGPTTAAVVSSNGQVVHVCQVVFSTSSPANVDFVAIQGNTSVVLSGNVNIATYSWDWKGAMSTRAAGVGAGFGLEVYSSSTIKGSMTYYLAGN